MKSTKKIIYVTTMLVFAVSLTSCVSTKVSQEEPKPVVATIEIDQNGNTPLMNYVVENRDSAVANELKNKLYYENNNKFLNTQNQDGNNALHLAIINRTESIVEKIVKSGIELNVRNNAGNAPLHLAVLYNDVALAEILLKNKSTDINITDKSGATPLILAAKKGFKDMVKFLLEAGANPKKTDNKGHDYKFYIPEESKMDAVVLQSDKHSDITNVKNIEELKVEAEPTFGVKTEKQIYTAPVDETFKVPEQNPQNYEIIFGRIPDNAIFIKAIISQDYLKVTEGLNKNNKEKSMQERDTNGNSALMYAVTLDDSSYIKPILIDGRELVNTPNNSGQTPLMAAIASKNHASIKRLLDANANVNARDVVGNTALSIAVMQDDIGLAKTLIQKGTRTSFKYKDGNNILQQAVINNSYEMVKMIKQNCPDIKMNEKNNFQKTVLDIAKELSAQGEIEERILHLIEK